MTVGQCRVQNQSKRCFRNGANLLRSVCELSSDGFEINCKPSSVRVKGRREKMGKELGKCRIDFPTHL